jgi:hypothetical protein
MAAKFTKGTVVHQIVSVVSGTVQSFSVDQESGDVQYFVEWQDADGVVHSRYFTEAELAASATTDKVGSPVVQVAPATPPTP